MFNRIHNEYHLSKDLGTLIFQPIEMNYLISDRYFHQYLHHYIYIYAVFVCNQIF